MEDKRKILGFWLEQCKRSLFLWAIVLVIAIALIIILPVRTVNGFRYSVLIFIPLFLLVFSYIEKSMLMNMIKADAEKQNSCSYYNGLAPAVASFTSSIILIVFIAELVKGTGAISMICALGIVVPTFYIIAINHSYLVKFIIQYNLKMYIIDSANQGRAD